MRDEGDRLHIDAEKGWLSPPPKETAKPQQAAPKKKEPRRAVPGKAAAQPRPRRRLPRGHAARHVYYVSGGTKYARMIPEIYYPSMARQCAAMIRIAVERYGKPIRFADVMEQHKAQCRCGFQPKQAHQALVLALREHAKTRVRRPPALTNIKWD